MIVSQVFINFGPELQGGEWAGGREGRVGVGGWGGRWQKLLGEDMEPPIAPRWSRPLN